MLDPLLLQLLEQAVNTTCKLALVLLYAEHDRFAASPQQLAMRLGRDPYTIEADACELASDGILHYEGGTVTFGPAPHWHRAVQLLRAGYDDPYQRDAIMSMVRELESYAPYRSEFLIVKATAA